MHRPTTCCCHMLVPLYAAKLANAAVNANEVQGMLDLALIHQIYMSQATRTHSFV